MDKQLIERIALEVAEAMPKGFLWREGCGYEAGVIKSEVRDFAHRFLARIDAERGKEAVAWFACADNNGSVPLELWGFDEKSCKHAVLENARSVGWKGTIDGYLLHMSWIIRPLFLSPTIPEGVALVPVEPSEAMLEAWKAQIMVPVGSSPEAKARRAYKAMLAAAQGERNAD